MGSEKQSTQSSTQVTPTAEETAYNKLLLERQQAGQAGMIQAQDSSLGLINQLLTGQQLPGYLNTLPGGINQDQTNQMIGETDRYLRPQFQKEGIFDSGSATTARTRAGVDVANQNAQFNVQNLMQLLNLASGQAAQNQTTTASYGSNLSSALAGLRSTSSTSTQTSPNPFLQSFQSSLGNSLGSIRWNPSAAFGIGGKAR
jgi:hypothetical protein